MRIFNSFWCVFWLNDTEVSERTDRNLPARNTLLKVLAMYTDPESHKAQRYRQADEQVLQPIM